RLPAAGRGPRRRVRPAPPPRAGADLAAASRVAAAHSPRLGLHARGHRAVLMDRVRVLWLIKGLGPGGTETLLAAAAAARDTEHFDYSVAYLVPVKTALVPALQAAGVRVTCFDARGPGDLRWARRLR